MFTYLIMGNAIFCLVDYDFYRNRKDKLRDVCSCIRKSEGNITFSVRGIGYGGISDYEIKESENSEIELFKQECERLNVEWVLPYNHTAQIDGVVPIMVRYFKNN